MKSRRGGGGSVRGGTARDGRGEAASRRPAEPEEARLVCVRRSLASALSRGATGSDSGCPARDSVGAAGAERGHGVDAVLTRGMDRGRHTSARPARPSRHCVSFNLEKQEASAPGAWPGRGGQRAWAKPVAPPPAPAAGQSEHPPESHTQTANGISLAKLFQRLKTMACEESVHRQVLRGDNYHYYHYAIMTIT